MPRGDGTGPDGQGSMTGRGAGYCNGFDKPGFANSMSRRGRGFGRRVGSGRGFGFRRFWNTPIQAQQPTYPQQPTKEQEIQTLEEEAKQVEQEQKDLNNEREEIKKRIEDLRKE